MPASMQPDSAAELTGLAYLGWVFQNTGYEVQWQAPGQTPEQVGEELWVEYGPDARQQPLLVRLNLAEDQIALAAREAKLNVPAGYGRHLQLRCPLNIAVKGPSPALDEWLLASNSQLPCGAFGLQGQRVEFQHVQLIGPDQPDARLIVSLIETAGFCARRFSPSLEKRLTGGRP